jgi:predicted alpha/beta-fold hydrolase
MGSMNTVIPDLKRYKASDFPPFRPRVPWLGGDLQTLRNYLRALPPSLAHWPGRRLELALADGSSDRLAAMLHRPETPDGRPLAVLIHGLTGCENSSYIRASARHLLRLGYPVLRLNLRGAGPSGPLCRFRYHAGRSEDLRDALAALEQLEPGLLAGGLLLVGYSLGANMLLKFLAEYRPDFPLRAAAAISAPIDLKAAQVRLMAPRNALYHRYLLARMKAETRSGAALSAVERSAVARARSVYQFDDGFVAPAGGFADAEDYYRRCSAGRFLASVAVPTLVVHARDDPWIPAAAYDVIDWRANPRLVPLLPTAGGHVGFHGRGARTAWHDHCIGRFVESVLA